MHRRDREAANSCVPWHFLPTTKRGGPVPDVVPKQIMSCLVFVQRNGELLRDLGEMTTSRDI